MVKAEDSESEKFEYKLSETIRAHALSLPEASEGSSCVNRAFRAGGKNFAFVGEKDEETNMRLKLGDSISEIAERAVTDPARWQVGKGGWAMLRFDPAEPPAQSDLERWVNESFRLLVPKKISAKLEG